MNTKTLHDDATQRGVDNGPTDSATSDAGEQANPDAGGAALAAGGDSSGGAREASEARLTPLSAMPLDDLLDHAERGIGLAELASDALLTAGDGMAMLGHCHHALFCRRVDTMEHAQRRDRFHERLHALRARVSEAKRVEEAPRLQAEAQRRAAMAASVSAGPQPMGGVVDAAMAQVRAEVYPIIYELQKRVKTLEMLQQASTVLEAHRDGRIEKLEAQHEGDASPLDRIAALEARVNKLTNAVVMSAVGNADAGGAK